MCNMWRTSKDIPDIKEIELSAGEIIGLFSRPLFFDMRELDRKYKNAHITRSYSHSDGERYYRVQVGLFSNLKKAEESKQTMRERGFENAFIVAE